MRPLLPSCKLLLPLLVSSLCFAAQADRISAPIDSGQMVALPGQVHRKALPQYDVGRVSGSLQISQVTLLTVPTSSQQAAISQLLAEQQDRKSPNFHKWLTPEQYADRFGVSQDDLTKITSWLQGQGLSIAYAARGRSWIAVNGRLELLDSRRQFPVLGQNHA